MGMTILDILSHRFRLLAGHVDAEKYIAAQPVILVMAEVLALYASGKRKARDRIMLLWIVFAVVGAAAGLGLLFFKL